MPSGSSSAIGSGSGSSSVWRPQSGRPLVESLAAIADQKVTSTTAVPWRRGYELTIVGAGGIEEREDRRITVAAMQHTSYVGGDLTRNVDEAALEVDGAVNVAIGPTPKSGGSGSASSAASAGTTAVIPGFGEDKLDVTGTAAVHVGERMTLMNGAIRRNWNGRVMRLAGMEGVICAGLWLRAFAGVSASMSALMSGDVYGGAARAAVARVQIGGFFYRSAELAGWAGIAHVRSTSVTIEPIIGSPTQHTPETKLWKKLGRLSLALCPFLDMAIGLITMPFNIAIAAGTAIANKINKKPPRPPAGPPRLRTRTAAYRSDGSIAWLMI